MIGITTVEYDPDGARIFRHAGRGGASGIHAVQRRISRRSTLDGGISVYDNGMSHGDREILVMEPQADLEAIEYATRIVETYNRVVVSTREGVFLGAPESARVDTDGTLVLTLWVIEKISD